jgi:hypothetical protein
MTPCGCLAILARNETRARMHGTDDSDLESGSSDEVLLLPDKCLECDNIVLGGGLCISCRSSSCGSSSGSEEDNRVVAAPVIELSKVMQRLEIGSARHFAENTTQQATVSAQRSVGRAPAKKKTRVIESDSDEAEFQLRLRAQSCVWVMSAQVMAPVAARAATRQREAVMTVRWHFNAGVRCEQRSTRRSGKQ